MTPARARPGLLAVDIDGTLLSRDHQLSDESAREIARACSAGWELVLVTGRPPRWIDPLLPVLVQHGLYTGSPRLGSIVICLNGAMVYEPRSQSVLRDERIDVATASELVDIARAEAPALAFAAEVGTRFGVEPDFPSRWALPDGVEVAPVSALVRDGVSKLLARPKVPMAADETAKLLRCVQPYAEIAWQDDIQASGLLIEIQRRGVDKARTLEDLAMDRGLGAEDVIAFGDMPNDIPMLRWAGTGVAMRGAPSIVLEAADVTTLSVDEAGIAHALRLLVPE